MGPMPTLSMDLLTQSLPFYVMFLIINSSFALFPQDFEETLQLVRDYHFPSLFINQFFPRPGTPAAKMQRVPAQEVSYA